MRDNLFEIITSSRTFYVQVKSPLHEDFYVPFLGTVYADASPFPVLSLLFCLKFLVGKFSP